MLTKTKTLFNKEWCIENNVVVIREKHSVFIPLASHLSLSLCHALTLSKKLILEPNLPDVSWDVRETSSLHFFYSGSSFFPFNTDMQLASGECSSHQY